MLLVIYLHMQVCKLAALIVWPTCVALQSNVCISWPCKQVPSLPEQTPVHDAQRPEHGRPDLLCIFGCSWLARPCVLG